MLQHELSELQEGTGTATWPAIAVATCRVSETATSGSAYVTSYSENLDAASLMFRSQ